MWEVVARRGSAKSFSLKFHKIHRQIPELIVMLLKAAKLANLFKRK